MYREAVKESVIEATINQLKAGEGMLGLEIRRLQPSTSAQNIVTEITKLGHNIKAVDLGLDIFYTYLGLFNNGEKGDY